MNTKHAFHSAVVGGIDVKNRIFHSATTIRDGVDGKAGQVIYNTYEHLCQGSVGLIVTGYLAFSQTDHYAGEDIALNHTTVSSLKNVTDMVHQYGTKIVAQLNHGSTQLFAPPEGAAFGPSEYVDPASGITATAFSREQILELIQEFGQAASLAKSAGFDGVQIHGAHGYLLNKFLSPAFNTRTDEYGGELSSRLRIVAEIFHEIKSQCGRDFPVWIKLNSSDFHPENKGVTEDDFLKIGEELSRIGMDAIEVSGGSMAGTYSLARSKKHTAYHLEPAKNLIEKVDASVILVGGIRDIDVIYSILSDTRIDAVSISRALVREPHLVKRWMDGERAKAACVACNGCFSPKGARCFFELTDEEQDAQRPMMKMMQANS